MRDDCVERTSGSYAAGLEIQLIKKTYVFPWSQFIFAEGDADEIRISFSTHDVVIIGEELNRLLTDIVSQRVNLLKEAVRAKSFRQIPEPHITKISIKKVE